MTKRLSYTALPAPQMRALIEERIKALGMNMADLSRAIGKNPSYMHQFLRRGSPPYLSESGRRILSDTLQIPEHALFDPGSVERERRSEIKAAERSAIADVPTFLQSDEIAIDSAREHLPRLINAAANGLLAIRIETSQGRLEAGDVAYLARQAARIGDTVFAIEDRRVRCWGRLVESRSDELTIDSDGATQRIPRPKVGVLRLVAIVIV